MRREISMNSILNLVDIIGWYLSKSLWSFYLRIVFNLKGVKLGEGAVFYGFTKLKRARYSKIIIGKNLTLRSSATSNLIGINRPCIISALTQEARLTIGDRCGFSGTVIGCFKEISIGNNVRVGANTLISDSDWHSEDSRIGIPTPVIIGDNVWLGVNVIVLKGVNIGSNTIIGAGSVVTHDIPPDTIAAGNPCKVIRQL